MIAIGPGDLCEALQDVPEGLGCIGLIKGCIYVCRDVGPDEPCTDCDHYGPCINLVGDDPEPTGAFCDACCVRFVPRPSGDLSALLLTSPELETA